MRLMSETAQRLNIRQIADLAGVSIATVSRVLNGRGDVSEETREVVSRVIRENGYTANRNARGLSAGRSGLVGVLVPLVYPAYFSGILAGAAEALSERDIQIVLSPTGGEHDREVFDRRSSPRPDRRGDDHPPRRVERGLDVSLTAAFGSLSSTRSCLSKNEFRQSRQRTCRAPTRR